MQSNVRTSTVACCLVIDELLVVDQCPSCMSLVVLVLDLVMGCTNASNDRFRSGMLNAQQERHTKSLEKRQQAKREYGNKRLLKATTI